MSDVIHKTTLVYLQSVNTPDYPQSEWIRNPDLSLVKNVPKKYWKMEENNIVEMTQEEKNLVDQSLLSETVGEKNFLVTEYDKRKRLISEVWYNEIHEDNFIGKVEDTVYTWDKKKLVKKTITKYYLSGDPIGPPEEWEFYSTNNKQIHKRL